MSNAIPIAGAVIAAIGVGAAFAVPDARTAMRDIGRSTGIMDTPSPPSESYDVIVDISNGSSGRAIAQVSATLDMILARMVLAPGSVVTATVQGEDALDAVAIATVTSTASKRSNRRARDAHRKQFMEASRELLVRSVDQHLAENRMYRSSPIAETISIVAKRSPATTLPPQTPRHIIVLSDALEVSVEFGDFECGTLPTASQFVRALHARGAFTPGSLTGADLHFAFVQPRKIPRKKCATMTLARMEQIQALWVAAGQSAGATMVTFDSGVVTFAALGEEE